MIEYIHLQIDHIWKEKVFIFLNQYAEYNRKGSITWII